MEANDTVETVGQETTGAPEPKLKYVKLAESVRQRVLSLLQQEKALEQRRTEILTVALESMGVLEGTMSLEKFDGNTGMVTLKEVPSPEPQRMPNRAQRRAAGKP